MIFKVEKEYVNIAFERFKNFTRGHHFSLKIILHEFNKIQDGNKFPINLRKRTIKIFLNDQCYLFIIILTKFIWKMNFTTPGQKNWSYQA